MAAAEGENVLLTDKHLLLCLNAGSDPAELVTLKENFCGVVVRSVEAYTEAVASRPASTWTYVVGDVAAILPQLTARTGRLIVVQDFSSNYEGHGLETVLAEQVPVKVGEIGVFFKNVFPSDTNYFLNLTREHQFQALTESTKPSNAFRKGIYLTPVAQRGDELTFHLLRCSSNLNGPTDNFRATDHQIVGRVNELAAAFFALPTDMNHVLAQVYENHLVTGEDGRSKERKAKISPHSDKTKDMPRNGLMAFTTFYDHHVANPAAYTRLRWRPKFPEKEVVDVVLYPNSVLLVPLSVNRLWTHEIAPSALSMDQIPTRLGYVIRCSNTRAVFKDGQTYIEEDGDVRVKLAEADAKGMHELRELYLEENKGTAVVHYPRIYFSFNLGDYSQPLL